ncbi:beta-microseminoprotein-like [Megalobrama amblycephala]|uniref:beta-microseminoprotein-like n=1 Tax=Megalobrama amblycephala TaxID=75352 RepID=UPI0020144ADD|nr:beta-microseminoprotein-like [Megalobrama amblycephala]XP_048047340.1 beta-microseminoprotein-like [Megalobrama amblycephala]
MTQLRLFVLLTAVVCCYACTLRMDGLQDTTDSPDCSDSDGNLHEFDSEWQTESEMCVCAHIGIICCPRFGNTFLPDPIPESTPKIYYDDFGAFTENDIGEP